MLLWEVLITNEYGCTVQTVARWSSCCTVSFTRLVPQYKYNPKAMCLSGRKHRITILIGCARDIISTVALDHRSRCLHWLLQLMIYSTIRVTFDEHRPSQYEEPEQQTPYFRSPLGCDLCYGSLARRGICWGCYCCSIGSISHEHCFFHLCNLQFFDLMERGSPPPQGHTLVGRFFTEGLLSLAYLCQRSSASHTLNCGPSPPPQNFFHCHVRY